MLIQAIHSCAVKFPDIAANVIDLLMDFLGDTSGGSAVDVVLFVREVLEMYSDLRQSIVRKLLDSLNQIRFYFILNYSNSFPQIFQSL